MNWSEKVSAVVRAVAVVVGGTLSLWGLQQASAQNVQPIYSFPQGPITPYAALVAGPDGDFYGTTWAGGSGGEGTVFKVTTNGAMTLLYSFSPPTTSTGTYLTNPDGAQPESALALGPDGNFYGTTWKGGPGGDGTVFRVTTNGVLTTLVSFAGTNGANPETGLTLGPDGNLYGTTSGGGSNADGTVFKVTTNGVFTTLHSFTAMHSDGVTGNETNADGADLSAGLTLGPDGNFYGATSEGGSGGSGTLFMVTTNGALNTIYTFSAIGYNESGTGLPDTNSDGESPTATLTLGADGNFYGSTYSGGQSGSGTVFQVTPNGVLTTLYSFSGGRSVFIGGHYSYTNSDGAHPYAGLTQGPNGDFYGTASRGGSSGIGTLFEISTGGSFTPLLTFTNGNGANPGGALILAKGIFYGTTGAGGSSGNGSVFAVTPSGALTTLFSFGFQHGAIPYGGLTLGPNGNFYGTTFDGGSNGLGVNLNTDGYGTLFQVTPNGALATLVNFAGTNGANPQGSLIPGPNGSFYGTTYYGGGNNDGTVFEVGTNGILTTLASFAFTNGANPVGNLILGANGNFYGTTVNGGANEYGTVFEVTTNGVLTTLHSFTYGDDGAFPYAGLTLGTNGNFYGTSAYGGKDGYGTVFEVTNNGGFAVLYSFTDGSDGADPYAALTLGPDGNFYGTTAGDDNSTYGNVFEMNPNGALTNLHSFTGGNGSGSPNSLTLGPDGNLYGTTYGGTTAGDAGGVFEVTSNGAFAMLVSFTNSNGEYPKGNLILGPDGNFYGVTAYGGADGIGELYRLDLPPEIIQQPASQSAATGAAVTLAVTCFGTGPDSFQWLSNNIPLLSQTNDTLTFPDFAAGDAANYSVVVSNAWGGSTSVMASLTVAAAPVISGLTLSANGNVILNCLGPTNVVSRLWATTNLAVPLDWTPIFTNSVTPASGAWQFTDTNSLCQQRYYRLSTP